MALTLPTSGSLCVPHRGPARLVAWALSYLLPAACAGCGARLGIDQRQGLCLDCWRALEPRPRPACARCAEPLPSPAPACPRCRRQPPPYDWAEAIWEYAPPARGAVLAFKYGHIPGLAAPLAEAALRLSGQRLARERPVLVPVPLHAVRQRQRGANAAEALARALAAPLGLRVARALERPHGATPQAGLGRQARQRNADASFRLARPEEVFGRRAVIVDDVLTTGATAGACARLLRGAGARDIGILALARARLE